MDTLIAFLFSPFQQLLDILLAGFQYLLDFFGIHVYEFVTKTIAQLIKAAVIAEIKFKIFAVRFLWDIARDLIQSLNFSSSLNLAFSRLDYRILQVLVFFRVPEGLNLVISAFVTKFVYRFMGFN